MREDISDIWRLTEETRYEVQYHGKCSIMETRESGRDSEDLEVTGTNNAGRVVNTYNRFPLKNKGIEGKANAK